MTYTTELHERFWSKVDSTGDCWEWTAATSRGYGSFKLDGKSENAHRISYRWYVGPIQTGDYVCHACDNPSCIRPGHLFAAPPLVNVADKVRKGRQAEGSQNGRSKLTEEDVLDLRRRWKTQGGPGGALAKVFAYLVLQSATPFLTRAASFTATHHAQTCSRIVAPSERHGITPRGHSRC